MAAVGVGLAGANFAYQMDATSWGGTGEFMRLGTPQADAHVQAFNANAANETTRTGTFMSTNRLGYGGSTQPPDGLSTNALNDWSANQASLINGNGMLRGGIRVERLPDLPPAR